MTLGSAAVQSKACVSLGEPIDLAGVVSILFCKLVLSYKAMDVPWVNLAKDPYQYLLTKSL